jgi:hypothetical protein
MDSAPKTEPIADVASTPPNRPNPGAKGAATVIDPWLMVVPAAGMADYVLCPPGNYPGTISSVIDIGHQPNKFAKEGSNEEVRQLVLVFELVERQPDGKPFLLSLLLRWSLHEKANFFKIASGVTGRTFREGDRFSPEELKGGAVLVLVGNAPTGEKVYHRVESAAAYPKGMPVPTPVYPTYSYSIVTGGPFHPPYPIPFIFGEPIEKLLADSREAKARALNDNPF